jgi:hypothetical protein
MVKMARGDRNTGMARDCAKALHNDDADAAVLPRFLEARWRSVACRPAPDLDDVTLPQTGHAGAGYMDYIPTDIS